ncbi:MAG TPA: ABC transporter substrate-binding protein [Chloroflexota bacterium]|jgi:ABC-type nitrate/sulfonate/bicarbonate transport system substrate-binding protein|nr:ABC transporter substrate-binding protein [Chloroflexota bacterium]
MNHSRLRVCTFKGMQNLALYVAEQEGLFAARDLAVEVLYTTGSAAQLNGLARGDYDLAQTAPDNVVNADDDPAAFGLDPATAPRLTMLMGGSTGPLGLYATDAVRMIPELRGATLGVDNPRSGFALVLRDMLARHGLLLDRDYRFAPAGGTSDRLRALRAGEVPATILYTPYDTLAEAAGFRRLAGSEQQYAAYASLATAATVPWVAAHGTVAARYIAAVRDALRLIYAPARAPGVQALIRERLQLDDAMAARAHAAFVDPSTGFGAEARLDDAGLRQVIALRAAYGTPRGALQDPSAYQDPGPYTEASRLPA